MRIQLFVPLSLLVSAAIGCRVSSAPVPVESGAYVVTLGADTIAVEQYTRLGDRIEGRIVQRSPRTVVSSYVLTLGPAGSPSLLEYSTRLPDGSLVPNLPRSITATFTADSVIALVQRDTVITMRIPARAAHFTAGGTVSLYAMPIAALRGGAMNRDSALFVTYSAGARQAGTLPIVRKGPNTYWVYYFGSPQVVTTDDRGRVLSVDATGTTFKFRSERRRSVDIQSVAAAWAARERVAGAMGAASPRDTVNANVGGARIWVDYSRPAARGRVLFGPNGVLGDTLWRTGANAATQFRTDVELVMAGRTIPPGMYTLFTLAVPGRYHLIFNRQTGQWGTEYDPNRDFARVPLSLSQLSDSVERFTIAVEPTGGNDGVMKLMWGTTQLSVPFTVR